MTRRKPKQLRTVPPLNSDEEAEAFLEQDLSDLDFSQFKRMRLTFIQKPNDKAAKPKSKKAGKS